MRIYTSTDAGQTWNTVRAHPPPTKFLASCSSDPGVAIDQKGRQYYSFVRAEPCRTARASASIRRRSGGARGPMVEADPVAMLGRARL